MRSLEGRVWLGLWAIFAPAVWAAPPLPDLALTEMERPAVGVVAGVASDIQLTVRNGGSAPAPETSVTVTVSGTPGSVTVPVPALAPGESARVSVPVTLLQDGPYVLSAEVDAAGMVQELRKGNNRLQTRGVAAPGGTDLIVLGVSLTAECRVAVRIRNIGTGVVPATEWLEEPRNPAGISLLINGQPVGWTPLREADPEQRLRAPSGELEWVSTVTVADRAEVGVYIDDGDALVESNALNNDLTRSLVCPSEEEEQPSKVRPHAPLLR